MALLASFDAQCDEAALRALIELQEQRIAELERKVEALTSQQTVAAESGIEHASDIDSVKRSAPGFVVTAGDGVSTLRLRGLLHFDGRIFENDDAPETADAWVLRRARPSIEGSLADFGEFRFTPEFGGGRTTILDASLAIRLRPALTITAGKFKVPVGLERLMSASALPFIERGFPTSLVPNRDLGLQLSGETGSVFTYSVGYFNGVTDGGSSESNVPTPDAENDTSSDWAARVFVTPFAARGDSIFRELGFGLGTTYTDAVGSADVSLLPTFRTPGQQVFFRFRNGTFADGERIRVAPQLYYYRGALGALAEYTRVEQDVTRATPTGSRSETLATDAWQLQLAWMLTGERELFKRHAAPARPFSLEDRLWGAVELVARYHELSIDPAAFTDGEDAFADANLFASNANSWGLGINWYFNAYYSWSLTYDRTRFNGGAEEGDRPDESVVLTRFGVAF